MDDHRYFLAWGRPRRIHRPIPSVEKEEGGEVVEEGEEVVEEGEERDLTMGGIHGIKSQ